jgi:uncharacterized phiE125 gp8 family phage protein
MVSFVVVTPPAEEPVSVDEARYHCRIDEYNQEPYEDSVQIKTLIAAARQHAESQLNRKLVTQTLDAYYDCFQSEFVLPPLQSVTYIKYVDETGTEQTLAADKYLVNSASVPARITESYGNTWPTIRSQQNAVRVRFVAGYGAASAVPQCVKNWMLMRIKTLYDGRDQMVTSNGNFVFDRQFIDSLLDSERVWGGLV